jgi:hypothetical protein
MNYPFVQSRRFKLWCALPAAMLLVIGTSADRGLAEDWARESLEMAHAPGTHISQEPTKAGATREIAERQAAAGEWVEARRTAEGISYEPSKAAAFGAIAALQARANPRNVAEARRTADHIRYRPYQLAAYREIVRAQMRVGDVAEAKRTAAHLALIDAEPSLPVPTLRQDVNSFSDGLGRIWYTDNNDLPSDPAGNPLLWFGPRMGSGGGFAEAIRYPEMSLHETSSAPVGPRCCRPSDVTGVWFGCGRILYDHLPHLDCGAGGMLVESLPLYEGPGPRPCDDCQSPDAAPVVFRPAPASVPAKILAGLPANYLAPDPVHGAVVDFSDSTDSSGTRVTGRTYADGAVVIETPRPRARYGDR